MFTPDLLKNSLTISEDENYSEPLAKRFKFNSTDCSLLHLFVAETWKANEKKRSRTLPLSQTVDATMVPEVNTDELKNVLPFLLKCRGDINYVDENGQTILHIYLMNNESCYIKTCKEDSILAKSTVFKIVKSLLERGASVNAADKYGRTPVHIAAMIKNKLELIMPMLAFFNNIDARDNEGNTVLHTVVRFYASLIINGNLLLQFPCQIYQDPDSDENVLFGIVCVLLSKGADPNKRNNLGMTPLQYAIRHCKVSLLRIFKEYNADFNVQTDNGDNLLNLVVHEDHCSSSCAIGESRIIETIDYLVNQGCDVNRKNKDGFSIIHFAAKRIPADEIIERLVELGAEVNCQTREKRQTPLHLAFINYTSMSPTDCTTCRFKNIIGALTYAGADWYAIDYQGRTPLHYVLGSEKVSIWSWILRFGVNINDRNAKNIVRECNIKVSSKVILVAVELKTVGFPIDREYELTIANSTNLRKHRERCSKEINKMRAYIVSDDVSLYQFLHMDWRRQFALVDFVPDNLEEQFPIYNGLIWRVCNKAIQRSQWFEPAKMAFRQITKMDLPDTCLERVIDFLNNWSLKTLIDASKTVADFGN